jgi:hypothetical protein
MVTDSFLGLACAALIATLFGLTLTFAGWRFFLILLPIWGFFFGLAFGADTMQALFDEGFLATITSWVVGFLVGAVFAVLSYLFYAFAVAIIAGALGYAAAVGLLLWIGMDPGFLLWLIGVIAGAAVVVATFFLNLQKWLIVAATAILGAAVSVGTIGLLFMPAATLLENPIKAVLDSSPLLFILFLVLAVFGIVVQARASRSWKIEEYNRWNTEMAA